MVEENNVENETNSDVDSSIENEIENQVETGFAKNLFHMITEYQEKLSVCEDKLQRALADYQNLERRSQTEISQRVLDKTNQLMLNFIEIYEDFIRAKTALSQNDTNTEGLDGIMKNMEIILSENNIKPIDAIGEIFDPNLHEAVSIVEDDSLDEGTITKEVAKGYISSQDVIKPSKVIVSKKK
jgi:molecular chaperone GrpE|tara:strand:+ start:1147 stop:1698 length:552 start_codon:yes stop_codon:yes gene_type:complete